MSIIKSVLIFLILFVVLGAVKDLYFQSLLEKSITQATGLRTTVSSLSVSPFAPHFRVKEILIDNPEGFEERHLARISEAFVDWNIADLLKGKCRLRKAQLTIEEFFVIQKKEGLLNTEILLAQSQRRGFPLRIDELDLTIERVISKKSGNPAGINQWDLMIRHKRFKNLEGFDALIRTVLSEVPSRKLVSTPR